MRRKKMKEKNIILKRTLTLAFALVSFLTLMTGISFGADVDVYLRADVLTIPVNTFNNPEPIVMWGYAQCPTNAFTGCSAATVPGPTIRAKAGDVLTIHLKNNLAGAYTEPTSIIIPGQITTMHPVWIDNVGSIVSTDSRNASDITSRVRSFTSEASTGGQENYTWNGVVGAPGLKAGTYLYQSGTHPSLQVQMGLYGALIVDTNPAVAPKVAYAGVTYDSEAIVLYSEIDPELHYSVASGNYGIQQPAPPAPPIRGRITSTIDYNPRFFLVNGTPYTPGSSPVFTGSQGDTTIIRYLNAGLQTHVPIVQGSYMSIMAEDGNLLPYPREQYSMMLAAGKTLDAIITLPSTPGYIPIYDRTLDLTNGAAAPGGLLAYINVPGPAQYTLTVNKTGSTGNGTILAASMPGGISCGTDCQETYNSGTVLRLSAIPDAGSSFAGWSGDPSCTGIGTCIVTMNAVKTITGVFTPIVYHTVTPSVGSGNGTISPSTPQSVVSGNTASFTLNPGAHYHISSVGGDCGGTLVGNQYTTASVTGACNVIANFAIDQVTVTPLIAGSGSTNPSTPQTIDYNTSTSFTVNANAGFHIQSVTGCGGTLLVDTFTTGLVTANCTVTATFAPDTYTVNPSAGPGGAINPSTQQTVPANQTTAFLISPNAGFQINTVTGCGGTFNANTNTYTTGPITSNCNVAATFVQGINVGVPNGGENWLPGTVQTIRWTYSGATGSFVKIDLYKGGVFNRTVIASTFTGTGGNGSYIWPVPSNLVPGTDYRIKVTSTTNSTLTDISNNNFTITGPTITVVAPDGGENWQAGTTTAITWTYTGNPGNVKIELFKGGLLNRTISASASVGAGGNGSFNWAIPSNQTTGPDFQIKVTSTSNGTVTDMSNANFTISPPPITPSTITLVAPNGGENWQAGTTTAITWTYTGNPGNVKIELFKGGLLNRTISASASVGAGGNGSFNWAIPSDQTTGPDFRITVTSISDGTVTDTSISNFTISPPPIAPPPITVVAPNGGENWTRGTIRTITWTYTGNPGTFLKIELLKGGVLNSTITTFASAGINGNGSFTWFIPFNQATGNNYQIRVTSTSNGTITDMSNANFTIQ